MTAKETIVIRTIINEAYPYVKMKNEDGDEVWFVMLKEYDFNLMKKVTMNFIKNGSKYAPNLSELIQAYEKQMENFMHPVVELMASDNYFDDYVSDPEIAKWNKMNRIKKMNIWILNNKVPPLFQKDVAKYKEMLKRKRIANKTKMLN